MPHLCSTFLYGLQHFKCRHEFAGRVYQNSEPATSKVADPFRKNSSSAKDGIKAPGVAGHQAPPK